LEPNVFAGTEIAMVNEPLVVETPKKKVKIICFDKKRLLSKVWCDLGFGMGTSDKNGEM
jgi:hypothetical protein